MGVLNEKRCKTLVPFELVLTFIVSKTLVSFDFWLLDKKLPGSAISCTGFTGSDCTGFAGSGCTFRSPNNVKFLKKFPPCLRLCLLKIILFF